MEKKTPLYERHLEYKGKIVPFAGYLLPVQYETGVIKEHMAVRTASGLFDVSHMGEITLIGEDALENIQRLVTNDCSKMKDGQVKYSPMCYEHGGVVDDLLIYRRGEGDYLLVVNASNRHKDVEFMKAHIRGNVEFKDISDDVALLALQGPDSKSILELLTDGLMTRRLCTSLRRSRFEPLTLGKPNFEFGHTCSLAQVLPPSQ